MEPILYLIYMKDVPNTLYSTTSTLADNATIMAVRKSIYYFVLTTTTFLACAISPLRS